jgi:hypothetical protein
VPPSDRLVDLYLAILSRPPTAREQAIARSYISKKSGAARDAWIDLTWALINSPEFLYRH